MLSFSINMKALCVIMCPIRALMYTTELTFFDFDNTYKSSGNVKKDHKNEDTKIFYVEKKTFVSQTR